MSKSTQWLCIVCMLTPSIISAQEWVATYNGSGNGWDRARAIVVDSVGNVYVTGESEGTGTEFDYATAKYSSSGIEQWTVRYNGPGNYWDIASGVFVDNVGNVYVTGYMHASPWNRDYGTVKYDSLGNELWVANYDGPGGEEDGALGIAFDNAGHIYVTGYSIGAVGYYDFATIKYDPAGVEKWVKRYNGPGDWDDGAVALAVDNSANIYVTGTSVGAGTDYDYATVKYDSAGSERWVVRYNGPGYYWDIPQAMVIDNSANVCVTGFSYGVSTNIDFATAAYDSSGIERWVARYNGPGNAIDWAYAIAVDNTGNVYVTGSSIGINANQDYATVKYDSLGVEQWVARYNGPSNSNDVAYAMVIDDVGNIYVTGESWDYGSGYDYATLKYDSLGVEQWVTRYNGPSNNADHAYAIAVDDAGYVYVTGESWGFGTEYDYVTVKYSPSGIEEQIVIKPKHRYFGSTIFHGPLQLPKGKKCKVFDITGRVVEPTKITRGIYFIEVDGQISRKLVKVK